MRKLFIPPALIAYSIIGTILLAVLLPQFNIIHFPWNLFGLPVAFTGFFMMGKTRDLFRKHLATLRIEQSNTLIQEGLFGKSRNPMYLFMGIMILGFSIVSTNVLSLLLPFIFLALVRYLIISREEKLLEQTFGLEYRNYCKKVRRWF